MAYAAVKSLVHTIAGHLNSCRISRESLQNALDHATSLEDALHRCSGWVTEMEEGIIIDLSRQLEDSIEFLLPAHFLEPEYDQLRPDVDYFAKTARKMEANIKESWEKKVANLIEESIMKLCLPKIEKKQSPQEEEEEEEVECSDIFLRIRDRLLTPTISSNVFSNKNTTLISGMAGIGKTRLAKKLFHDPYIKASFECRAFFTDGHCVAFEKDNKIMEGDYEDSDGSFLRFLYGKKTLFVFDEDDHRVENYSSLHFNKGGIKDKRSQILVTSRIYMGFSLDSLVFKMPFLNEEESWELLRRKVFGEDEEEDCPRELVKAGKKIAEECEGLPLLIIAVASILLSKAQKDPQAWKRIAEKPDSVLKEASYQISDQLLSNYHPLNEDEKLCYLYVAAFPKKYQVWATAIGYLWHAEGFIERYPSNHLRRFVQISLAMDGEKGDLWSVHSMCKACILHCAYWYVSRREAENKKILYTIDSIDDGLNELMKCHRRLAIYTNVLFAIKEVHDFMASISTVRSLLCTGTYHPYQVPICLDYWRLLKVLDARTIRFYEFPGDVVKLFRLKYLSLTCNADLPPSISELWKLQFLFVHQHSSIKRVGVVSYLPEEIWHLQELEVLHNKGRNLPGPPHPGAVLPKLRKLLDVGVESCRKGVLESLPSLQKLRVQIELAPHAAETMSCFDHLSCLNELCSFQSVVMNPTISHRHSPLPLSFHNFKYLCHLSMSGFGYPWEDICNIAELTNLTKLKLKAYAFRGEKWQVEVRFEKLDQLYIEDTDLKQWTAGSETFPRLHRMVMKNCHKLKEIPLLSTSHGLEIELIDCNPSAEAYTKQMYSGRDKRYKISASYSWKKKEKIK